MMAALKISIYLLCLLTAIACCVLLARGYRRQGARLLLWSAVCFGFLALHAAVVVLELLVLPGTDFQVVRHAASLGAVSSLIFGLVWEAE